MRCPGFVMYLIENGFILAGSLQRSVCIARQIEAVLTFC